MDEQNTGVTAAAEPRTREIRAEIEQTREDMSETVNAIQDRLRPGNIAANAADTVKEAARERVRDVTESDSVQYVRANPIPTAMVGIGIAGLVWLIKGGNEARGYQRNRSRRSAQDWGGRFDEQRQRDYAGSSRYSGYETAGGYTPGLSYSETETYYPNTSADARSADVRSDASWESRRGYDSGSRGGFSSAEMTARTRNVATRAQSTARRTWNENPLVVGAASAVLGAVVGLAVPETERENQLMGETRDNLVDTVQDTVREKVEKVQDAATSAMGTVQEAATKAVGMSTEGAGETRTPKRG